MISTRDLHIRLIAIAGLALSPAAAAAPDTGFVAEAETALARGDGIAAGLAVRRALEAGVPRERVAAVAGEAELLQGDLAAARRWLAPGRFARGTGARGFQALARLQIQQGDLAAATRAYDRALEQGGASAGLWVEIGRLRYRVGEHHLALAAVAKAMEIDAREPRALEFRGQLVRDARGPVAALPWFERALEKLPDDLGLLGEYAATLAEAGRHKDMLGVVRRMVELDPRHPRPYFLQAVLAARAGQDDLARRLLARAADAYDEVPAGRLLAGILELRTGNPVLAVDEFDELVRRQPDHAAATLLLGRALLAGGEAREVVARLGPAAERNDASPYLLALVGRAHEQLGDRQAAARYLDRAGGSRPAVLTVLPVDPDGELSLWRAGDQPDRAEVMVPSLRRLLAQGRRGEALTLAARMERRYAGSADVETLTGDVALLTGNPAAALAQYERAAEIRRDFALVERMVAALRMLGREDAAIGLLADYIALNPRVGSASALLGRIMAQRGDWRTGAILMDHARDLGGGSDPRLLADLAEAELASGNAQAAQEHADRAYSLQRANSRIAAVLARALAAQGADDGRAEALTAKARQGPARTGPAQR